MWIRIKFVEGNAVSSLVCPLIVSDKACVKSYEQRALPDEAGGCRGQCSGQGVDISEGVERAGADRKSIAGVKGRRGRAGMGASEGARALR